MSFASYRLLMLMCSTYRWTSLPLRCWMDTFICYWTWGQGPPKPRLLTEKSMTENGITWTFKGTDAQVHSQLPLTVSK